MPELNTGYLEPEYEKDLYVLRREVPDRFIITHFDGDVTTDEFLEAALASKLNFIELDGLPIAFGTNDPDRVEDYKRRVHGSGWQVFDSVDEPFTEANGGA